MTFARLFVRSSSQRAFATESHNEKPILPKMKQKRFNTRNHRNYTFIISSWAYVCISMSEKRANSKKKPYLRRTWHREIDTFDLIFIGERAENATFQNGQTDQNREFERGRSVELKSSTPRPPI